MTKLLNKKAFIAVFALALLSIAAIPAQKAEANTGYYYNNNSYQQPLNYYPTTTYYSSGTLSEQQMIDYLRQLIIQLQTQLASQNHNNYNNGGNYYGSYGSNYNYVVGEPRSYNSGNNRDDDEPDVYTDRAQDIDENEAELRGEVNMNDFEDGEVFFVYGTDEDDIEDVEYDFDSYRDVDTRGDRLEKVRVENNFDGDDSFREHVYNLEENEDYYFRICVGYEDEDDDDVIICGDVEEFETD